MKRLIILSLLASTCMELYASDGCNPFGSVTTLQQNRTLVDDDDAEFERLTKLAMLMSMQPELTTPTPLPPRPVTVPVPVAATPQVEQFNSTLGGIRRTAEQAINHDVNCTITTIIAALHKGRYELIMLEMAIDAAVQNRSLKSDEIADIKKAIVETYRDMDKSLQKYERQQALAQVAVVPTPFAAGTPRAHTAPTPAPVAVVPTPFATGTPRAHTAPTPAPVAVVPTPFAAGTPRAHTAPTPAPVAVVPTPFAAGTPRAHTAPTPAPVAVVPTPFAAGTPPAHTAPAPAPVAVVPTPFAAGTPRAHTAPTPAPVAPVTINFPIRVNRQASRPIPLSDKPVYTILEVKEAIRKVTGIPVDHQLIIFQGQELTESITKENLMKENQIFHVVEEPAAPVAIPRPAPAAPVAAGTPRDNNVNVPPPAPVTPKSTSITGKAAAPSGATAADAPNPAAPVLTVRAFNDPWPKLSLPKDSYTVAELKQLLYDREGTPIHQQRLVYRGRQLKDETLKTSDLLENGLNLVVRLSEGPVAPPAAAAPALHPTAGAPMTEMPALPGLISYNNGLTNNYEDRMFHWPIDRFSSGGMQQLMTNYGMQDALVVMDMDGTLIEQLGARGMPDPLDEVKKELNALKYARDDADERAARVALRRAITEKGIRLPGRILNPETRNYMMAQKQANNPVIIVTSRDEELREITVQQLTEAGFNQGEHYDQLIMTGNLPKPAFMTQILVDSGKTNIVFVDDNIGNVLPVARFFSSYEYDVRTRRFKLSDRSPCRTLVIHCGYSGEFIDRDERERGNLTYDTLIENMRIHGRI